MKINIIDRSLFSFFKVFILLSSICFISSCRSHELAEELSLKEANELVVYLNRAGIDCKRVASGKKDKYTIIISESDSPMAYEVMHEVGLPRSQDKYKELDKIYSNGRFGVVDKKLTKLKLDYINSLQAERLLSSIEGVSDIKVVIKSMSISGQSSDKSIVSLVVKILPEYDDSEIKASILNIIFNLVPDIRSSNISIDMSKISLSNRVMEGSKNLVTLEPFGFKILKSDKTYALQNLVYFFIVSLIAGIVLGTILARALLYKMLVNKKSSESSGLLLNDIQG